MKTQSKNRLLRALLLVALTATLLVSASTARAAEKLNIYCWSEYVPQSVIDAFTKETGIKVSVENYASNEEMLQKLLGGGNAYDLIQPSEYTVEGLIKKNLLLPLDKANIPNMKNLAPEAVNQSFDPDNKFSVPWMIGHVAIVVNTDKVKDDIKSYKDMFQSKYNKRIVVLDDSRELVTAALSTLGIDCNDINDSTLEKARGVLKDWLPLVKVYDSDSPKTAMLNGDTDLGMVWSGEGAKLMQENKKFKWIIPAEGTHEFIDSLAIPKTAKNKANAEKFMNFILRPEISVLISKEFPYTNPNAAARKLLSADELDNVASFPKGDFKFSLFKDIGKKASDVDALVTDLKGK